MVNASNKKKDKFMRRLIAVTLAVLVITSFLWVPALAYTVQGQPEKFKYYVEGLKYGLKAFEDYLNFIVTMFKLAVGAT